MLGIKSWPSAIETRFTSILQCTPVDHMLIQHSILLHTHSDTRPSYSYWSANHKSIIKPICFAILTA